MEATVEAFSLEIVDRLESARLKREKNREKAYPPNENDPAGCCSIGGGPKKLAAGVVEIPALGEALILGAG